MIVFDDFVDYSQTEKRKLGPYSQTILRKCSKIWVTLKALNFRGSIKQINKIGQMVKYKKQINKGERSDYK